MHVGWLVTAYNRGVGLQLVAVMWCIMIIKQNDHVSVLYRILCVHCLMKSRLLNKNVAYWIPLI